MLNITSQSDYGLMLISYLKDKKGYVPLSRLLNELDLPKRFLARIAALLVKSGILMSREGKVGGYQIAKKASNLNLYDYLKIFEGELAFTKCQDSHYDCPRKGYCKHKNFFKHNLTSVLSKELKKHKLLSIYH